MFDSLGSLIDSLGDLFPRVSHVYPYQKAIRFTNGKNYRVLDPGLYFYWPLLQEISKITVVPTTIDLGSQNVVDANGDAYAVALALVYEVRDVEKYYLSNHDTIGILAEVVQAELVNVAEESQLSEVPLKDISDDLFNLASTSMEPYGVTIKTLRINSFAPVSVMHVNTSGPLIQLPNSEDNE